MSKLFSDMVKMPLMMADNVTPMGKEDMIAFLNTEDDAEVIPLKDDKTEKTEKKSEKKTKTEEVPEEPTTDEEDDDEETTDEESDEEDELEEFDEDNNPDEEQLELITPVRRKDILKAYPDLFKKFPYLEKAYYREQQFTEINPTIEDARKSKADSDTLAQMESDLMEGKSEILLSSINTTDPQAFAKLVDNFLPSLAKVDNNAYIHIIGNIIKQTIASMVNRGRSSKNEALEEAAAILNQFVFNSDTYEPPTTLSSKHAKSPQADDESQKLKAERDSFRKEKFETARTEVNTRINNSIKATIEANIDPKQSMTDYNRKNASRDAMERIEQALNSDTRLRQIVDKLWLRASEAGYTKETIDRIRGAYLARAKTLLDPVIKKARNEALRGMGKRVKDDTEETETRKTSRSSNSDRPESSRKTGKITNAKDIPKKMTTLEFLNFED